MAIATFEPFPTLESARLVLREITASDADAIYRIYADPEVVRYWGSPPDASIEDAARRIEIVQAGVRDGGSIRWALATKREGRLIGSAGFWRWEQQHRVAEIGYELERASWGVGLMSEAIGSILRFGFGAMNLHRVEANVEPGNEASMGVLRKHGFREEGRLRENWLHDGRFRDTACFGLLRREWRAGAFGGSG